MSYARQYSMASLSDGSSILPGSTKLLFYGRCEPSIFRPASMRQGEEQYCGADLVSTAIGVVEGSCRTWTLSISVYQTKNAKNMLAKVAAFVKSLFVMPEFGMEPAASLA